MLEAELRQLKEENIALSERLRVVEKRSKRNELRSYLTLKRSVIQARKSRILAAGQAADFSPGEHVSATMSLVEIAQEKDTSGYLADDETNRAAPPPAKEHAASSSF